MESNSHEDNNSDTDARLPPHKRLLAGLKRHIPDVYSSGPSTPCSADCEYYARLNNLLRFHLSNPNLSNEELLESSRSAAIKATKFAEAKRANAEQKATKAAHAVAAAKNALELVANLEEAAARKDKKRNKVKKHVSVEAFYDKNKREKNVNCRADEEEVARNLDRASNGSPRFSKNLPDSDSKIRKHKKLKDTVYSTESRVIKEIDMITVDLNSKDGEGEEKAIQDNGEAGFDNLKDKYSEPLDSVGRKRGRIKQKKLPLSICSFKNRAAPTDEEGQSVDDSEATAERSLNSECDSQSKAMEL
ncbi:cysteine-rich RLK (RECEPTOR-like protein kinase)11 [Striga asiatica]|uniref:Cysteine-rich RLK (RECEPTOR-like protein kinase)11 n=1 Tax=Striga asiatica TaxID=4170 RepID=A0A5A7R138_STRAF|nr:cysteine-rich RLK (RECEPTOR-like protein kinase)11 [Striga asiatica]